MIWNTPPLVGYNPGEQHLGKSKIDSQEDTLPPQAGTHGQSDSHVSGQGGPEIMGGTYENQRILCENSLSLFILQGSASTRITGQSVEEQLKNPLPPSSGK